MSSLLLIIILASNTPPHSIQIPMQSDERCQVEKQKVADGVATTLRRGGIAQVAVTLTCVEVSG